MTVPLTVSVHPLVLLSVVDHYTRVAKNTNKRVVGVLLGTSGDEINITNSFALPFEEDEKDRSVWFIDHDYLTAFFSMFRKVNAKEKIVGWYSTGPGLKTNDLLIHGLLKEFCLEPVLVVVSVLPGDSIPTTSYYAKKEIHIDGTPQSTTFSNIHTTIKAEESEEIGVEQLLRDIQRKDTTALGVDIQAKLQSLETLGEKLRAVYMYLERVVGGSVPLNQGVCYALQDMLNVLPVPDAISITTTTNDQLGVLYLASLGRCLVKLHSLIDNKIANEVSV